jgi:hypothetical protein
LSLAGLYAARRREAALQESENLIIDRIDFPPDGVQHGIGGRGGHSFAGLGLDLRCLTEKPAAVGYS